MKFQFIKNCFLKDNYLMNKDYKKFNIIDDCYIWNEKYVIHYTEKSIEYIPREYLKIYKH